MTRKSKNDIDKLKNLSIKIGWKEFHYLLTRCGFRMEKSRGSIRVFIKEEVRFVVHKPHGRGDKIVAKIDRKKAVKALIELGCLEENHN